MTRLKLAAEILGVGAVVVGIGLMHIPAALIVAGLATVAAMEVRT